MKNTVGQIASVIGMILTIASFQMKTRKRFIIFQTTGSTFFLISYFLLGGTAGIYMNVVYLSRNIVFYMKKDKKWAQGKIWLAVFIILAIIAGVLGYQSPIDVLPICGALFATLAMYMPQENMIRLLNLGASPCWLIYNVNLPSAGGTICEVFNIISIVVALIRYRKDGALKPPDDKGKAARI